MKNKKLYPTNLFIRFFIWIVFAVFTKIFRIKKKLPKEVQQLKPPYLVLGNHVGYWDPFVTGHFLPHFTHFVSSDATFRKPIVRFLLTGLGTIPIKKNTRDIKAIKDILGVLRQGEVVGVFPEGLRNWDGSTFKMDPSIAKLIKLANVPVVVPILKGMNLFNPRWSTKLRVTKVEVDYKLLFSNVSLRQMDEKLIFNELVATLKHDEVAYQKKNRNKIYSKHKAEHISHALYVCPNCHDIDSFRASHNDFKCISCGYDIHIDTYGFFERISSGKLFFDNIRDWYNWEEQWLLTFIKDKFDNNEKDLFFTDKNLKFYKDSSDGKMQFQYLVDLELYRDKITIVSLNGKENLELNFQDLKTINPQINDRLELFYNDSAYRFVGERPGVSGLKWEVAVNAIWYKMKLMHKLSIFIDQD